MSKGREEIDEDENEMIKAKGCLQQLSSVERHHHRLI